MYRFNKWIDSLIFTTVAGIVFLIMTFLTNRGINWYSVIGVFIAIFLSHAFLVPRIRKK